MGRAENEKKEKNDAYICICEKKVVSLQRFLVQ